MAGPEGVVVGLIGALILALGVGIAGGRLWLLANYDPDAVADERRVARLGGGGVLAFGVLTLGFAWGLQSGRAGDWWWAGWAVVALVVAFGVAAVASGRA